MFDEFVVLCEEVQKVGYVIVIFSCDLGVVQVQVWVDVGELVVICLKVDCDGEMVVNDLLCDFIYFVNKEIDDKVLFKVDGFFIYYFVNVVDDCLM